MKAEPSKSKATTKVTASATKAAAAEAPVKTAARTAVKAAPVVPVAAVAASSDAALQTPVRSTRPSSRLAQLTVPSIAASNAAKAIYTNTMPSTMQAPNPAGAPKKDAKLANNWKSKPVEELSDAEVLAMHDDDYMNDVQMAFFRLKLVALKKEIHDSAGKTTETLREDTVVVPDPADRATIEEEHALELRTRDRERKLLKKIEQSIGRIDAGDYGYCDETGEPIGVGRLLARPTATLSLEAQQRRELRQKMFGD